MEVMRRAPVLAVLLALGPPAQAAEPPALEQTVREALSAVSTGAYDQGIDALEALSDRGVSHPEASYARAQAYVERARSRSSRPGDLGRAVAALEEYTRARPGDERAERAIDTIRQEIGRRRVRQGGSPVDQGPSLGRAIVGLLPENVWAVIAAVGATLLTLGLALRRITSRRSAEIAGAVGIAAGLVFGVTGALMTRASLHYRRISYPAVVVVPEARVYDAAGRALPASAGTNVIPEGALVYVLGRKNGYLDIEWGSVRGHVEAGQLRLLSGT
jgi:hypothetical protein